MPNLAAFSSSPKKPKAKKARKKRAPPPPPAKEFRDLRILGLDPALRHTGIVILDEEGSIIEQATFDNPKNTDFDKLGEYNQVVQHIVRIAEGFLNENVDYVIVREDYAFGMQSSADTILKELGGILAWELAKIPAPYSELFTLGIAPVKKWACGKGNAEKEDVMKGVKKHFKVEGSEHECDAFAVASLALELMIPGSYSKLTSKQKEVLATHAEHDLTKVKRRAPLRG